LFQVDLLETLIEEKKQQVEQLVKDMKEANLLSLSIAPATDDGIRSHLLEGVQKGAGSSRRMIGSPRQLENAVATSKNPHGVWV
jgi:Ras association domain-containing protein 7/8